MQFVLPSKQLLKRPVRAVWLKPDGSGVSGEIRKTCRRIEQFASGKTAPQGAKVMRLVGVAAPQLGIDRAIAFVNVTRDNDWTDELRLLINPTEPEVWGEDEPVTWWHRCFSCETLVTVRSLPRYMKIEYYDLDGICHPWLIDGKVHGPRQLHVVRHEMDHLLGIRHVDVALETEAPVIFDVTDDECPEFNRLYETGDYHSWPRTVKPEAWPAILAGRPWQHLIVNRAA